MNYINENKAAWEEVFDHRREDWRDDMPEKLKAEDLPYMNDMLKRAMRSLDLQGKVIAHFCCNNGREMLSAMQLGAAHGYGFDIAENMIAFARETAAKAELPCTFTACNILEIGAEYDGAFDLVLFTIGAITWFQDLGALFAVVARCLKPGGRLLINDYHPFVNMLPIPGEEAFRPDDLYRVAYSYFRSDPWLEQKRCGIYGGAHQYTHLYQLFAYDGGYHQCRDCPGAAHCIAGRV